MKHFKIALLLFLMALYFGILLPVKSQEIAFMEFDPIKGGVTICTEKNAPLILLNRTIQGDSIQTPMILEHEFTHVRQINNYPGGCKPFMERFQIDAQFRFDVEFEAYCINAIRDIRSGKEKPDVAALHLSYWMVGRYPTKLTASAVLARAQSCIETKSKY